MGYRLAISNIAWAPENDDAAYDLMHRLGYVGLEIAPTRVFPENPYGQIEAAAAWSRRLAAEQGFVVPSMQSIWYGRKENIFGSAQEREALLTYTRAAIDFAAACGISNLVFGCPRNRNMPENANSDDAITFFAEIARYASQCNCVIGLEANPPIYNTNYINETAQALAVIERVSLSGLRLNLDLGTMIVNGETLEILKTQASVIQHVHISEPGLKVIEPRALHRELAQWLRNVEYNGFVSIEMGRVDSLATLEHTMRYVRDIFGE